MKKITSLIFSMMLAIVSMLTAQTVSAQTPTLTFVDPMGRGYTVTESTINCGKIEVMLNPIYKRVLGKVEFFQIKGTGFTAATNYTVEFVQPIPANILTSCELQNAVDNPVSTLSGKQLNNGYPIQIPFSIADQALPLTEFTSIINIKEADAVVATATIKFSVEYAGSQAATPTFNLIEGSNKYNDQGECQIGEVVLKNGEGICPTKFTIKGENIKSNLDLWLMSGSDVFAVSLVDANGKEIVGDGGVATSHTAEELTAGIEFQLKFKVVKANTPFDMKSCRMKVIDGSGNDIFKFRFRYTLKEFIPASFAINGNIADKGTLALGKVEHDNGIGLSKMFKLTGTNVEAGDYTLNLTQNSLVGQGSLELCDATEAPIFVPGNKMTGTPDDAAPISADSLLAGQTLKVKFVGNPNIAPTEVTETLTLVDANQNVIYTATVKFSLDKKSIAPDPVFAINETIKNGDKIELGDLNFNTGKLSYTTKYVLKGENVTSNVKLNVMTGSSRYTVELHDAQGNVIVNEALDNDKEFTPEQLAAGIEFYLHFESMAAYAAANRNTMVSIKDAQNATLFKVTYTYSLVITPTFKINETIAEGQTLELKPIELKDGIGTSENFAIKGENVAAGNYFIKISNANADKGSIELTNAAGEPIYVPANAKTNTAEEATPVVADSLTAGQNIKVKFTGKLEADLNASETLTITDSKDAVLYTAIIKLTIKKEVKSAVDFITIADKIWSEQGAVCIEMSQAAQATIYTIEGKAVASRMLNEGLNQINLPAGIYVINIDGASAKVVVR